MKRLATLVASAVVLSSLAAIPAFASGEPTIQEGSTGSYVTQAQNELTNAGYSTYGIDGIFGSNTYTATVRFQKGHGLTQDGIIGPATWSALDAATSVNQDLATALSIAGEPSSWLSGMEELAQKESTDEPWAYNSSSGATGLMQMMPSTFSAYEMSGHTNIWNPIDNAVASARYIAARYGSPYNINGIGNSNPFQGYGVQPIDDGSSYSTDQWIADQLNN